MNRGTFIISQSSQDFSQNDLRSQSPFGSIISWFHARIDYKRESVIKPITDFADEFLDFLCKVLFVDPMQERFSR